MAYDFPTGDSASNNSNLAATSAPVTSAPATFVCWANPDINCVNGMILYIAEDAGSQNILQGYLSNVFGGNNNRSSGYVEAGNSGTVFDFEPQTNNPIGTWLHHAVVFTSTTSRVVYRNGVASTTINTTSRNTTGLTKLNIGYPTNSLDGKMAEFALYNVALTAAEIASLAKGFSPRRVRPQNLKCYVPMIRDVQDLSQSLAFTNNNGCTAAVHPRVY
jgi:hypothetical protein